MPVYKIHHVTRYEYNMPVRESMNEIKLFPYICNEQETLQHDIIITDAPKIEIYTDYWKNKTGTFNVLVPHQSLTIESKLLIRTNHEQQQKIHVQSGFGDLEREISEQFQLTELSIPDAILLPDVLNEIIQSADHSSKSVAAAVEYFSGYIYRHFTYLKDITDTTTTVDEILQLRKGVCQDFAHVLLQLLRTIHIPARYVSGYICANKNGMRGEGATHAWVEAWLPGYGWMGIDPTNNVWVSDTHVKLSVGRHFKDCTPVKGTFKGPARQTLGVYVSVGYEDGHIFEALNDVKMEVQSFNAQEKISAVQQQQ